MKPRIARWLFLLAFSVPLAAGGVRPPLCSAAEPAFKITDLKICQDVDKDRNPIKITNEFPAGTSAVYAWFAWEGGKAGFQITAKWHYATEDIHILDFPVTLTRTSDRGVIILRMGTGKTLPPGSYRLDIEAGGKVIKSALFTALPPAQRPPS